MHVRLSQRVYRKHRGKRGGNHQEKVRFELWVYYGVVVVWLWRCWYCSMFQDVRAICEGKKVVACEL